MSLYYYKQINWRRRKQKGAKKMCIKIVVFAKTSAMAAGEVSWLNQSEWLSTNTNLGRF